MSTVGRFDVGRGEAPPYRVHSNEDEVFMLIKSTALIWADDQESELTAGGIVFLPRKVPDSNRITSEKADLRGRLLGVEGQGVAGPRPVGRTQQVRGGSSGTGDPPSPSVPQPVRQHAPGRQRPPLKVLVVEVPAVHRPPVRRGEAAGFGDGSVHWRSGEARRTRTVPRTRRASGSAEGLPAGPSVQ